jgi:hypothetical protein
MKQKTSLIENGGTYYLRIPPALKEYLNLEVGEEITIEDKKKKHGKYAVFWNSADDKDAEKK